MSHRFATCWRSCCTTELPLKTVKMASSNLSITVIESLLKWLELQESCNKRRHRSKMLRRYCKRLQMRRSRDRQINWNSIAPWLHWVLSDSSPIISTTCRCPSSISSWRTTTCLAFWYHFLRLNHGWGRMSKVRWRSLKTKNGSSFLPMRQVN